MFPSPYEIPSQHKPAGFLELCMHRDDDWRIAVESTVFACDERGSRTSRRVRARRLTVDYEKHRIRGVYVRLRRLSMNSPLTGKVDLGLGSDSIFFSRNTLRLLPLGGTHCYGLCIIKHHALKLYRASSFRINLPNSCGHLQTNNTQFQLIKSKRWIFLSFF
jgi:hypothetical protein